MPTNNLVGGVLVCGLVSAIRRIPNFPKSSHLIFVMSVILT